MIQTAGRIERFYLWSSIGVYWAVWVCCLSLWFRPALLPLALATGLAYSAAYAWQLAYGGHCYLCADPYTLPVAGIVYAAGIGLYFAAGWLPTALGRWASVGHPLIILASLFVFAVFVGHMCALAYSATSDKFLRWMFRHRIRREQDAEPSAAADGGA